MLLLAFGIIWCVLAELPSQLLLLAVAILLRVLYVTGKHPLLSFDMLGFWLLVLTIGYFMAPDQSKELVIKTFCTLTLLGTLIIHVGQQTINSGLMQRIPGIRHIALFFGRYMVLGRREIADMNFWSKQHVRAVKARNADRIWLVRNLAVSSAYLGTRVKIVTCLFHDARGLIDKWDAVLSARGGLPSYKLSMLTAKRAPRKWYANFLADIALCLLLLLPLGMGNDVLIPKPIVEFASSLAGTPQP